MTKPTFANYVDLIFTLFALFLQQQPVPPHRGHPFAYPNPTFIVFFAIMQLRRLTRFKAQRRWLLTHPDWGQVIGFDRVPHRTTLSRRYKQLYPILQDFIAFLGQYAEDVDPAFDSRELYEDKSVFKAQGPVGTKATDSRAALQLVFAISTPTPPGVRVPIMAGSTAMAYM